MLQISTLFDNEVFGFTYARTAVVAIMSTDSQRCQTIKLGTDAHASNENGFGFQHTADQLSTDAVLNTPESDLIQCVIELNFHVLNSVQYVAKTIIQFIGACGGVIADE